MAASRKQINVLFAILAVCLAAAAVLSAIRTPRTVVRTESEATLPEDHPPMETVRKLTDLIRMSEEDPQNASVHEEIGNIYYDLKEYGRAEASYRRSLALEPGDPRVETDLATCLYYLGRHDEAAAVLDGVLGRDPGFAQALYNKGIVLIHGKNDIEGGLRAWRALLELETDPARRAELQESIRQLEASAR